MTALIQTQGASVPELPGSTVLRFDSAGTPGVLIHDLGTAAEVMHVRFLLNASQAAGGSCVIAGGIGEYGRSAWQLRLDAAAQSVTFMAGAVQLSVELVAPFRWQAIEIGIDTIAGTATLRLNGIERGAASIATSPTRHAWLGGAFPDSGLTGVIDFDDWVVAAAPIGVPVSTPQYDHAGDPRRWLVVYNRNEEDSATWAESYRARRGVPYANLCGLDLPADERITDAQYHTLRQDVAGYLTENGLVSQVVGILLGYGVPGYADLTSLGPTPIAGYLHTDAADGFTAVNPMYQPSIGDRPIAGDYGGVRLTGRIDAPDLATALALIDRADSLIDLPLLHDQGGAMLIDVNPDNPSVGPAFTGLVRDWAESADFDRLRLPSTIYDADPLVNAINESVVWAWRDAAPPSGFFTASAGRRALCLQLHPEPEPADTLRDPDAIDWLNTALQAGYATAATASRNYSLSQMPLPHLMFNALRSGWTLAEAWMLSQPFIRGGLQIVGDPLITIGFPKAGFDVFGPVDRLDQVEFDQPLAILHAGEQSLQLNIDDAPPPGEPMRYLVQRYDEQGRPDSASAAVFAGIEQGQVVRPAPPAWPGYEGWPALAVAGRLVLTAAWPVSLRTLGVGRVELIAEAQGDAPQVIDRIEPATGQHRAVFSVLRPDVSTRYRIRVVQGCANYDSPWSAWVDPASSPAASLTLLETQP